MDGNNSIFVTEAKLTNSRKKGGGEEEVRRGECGRRVSRGERKRREIKKKDSTKKVKRGRNEVTLRRC